MNHPLKSLILCRTPLQAYLCQYLVTNGVITSFDLYYVSHQDHEADRFYYRELARHSLKSGYLVQKPLRPVILSNLIITRKIDQFTAGEKYSTIYLASIDSFPFGHVLKNHAGAIVTFDDGAANVITPGAYDTHLSLRDRFYRQIFGIPPPESIVKQSSGHFSIYKGLPNIVEKSRIRFIDIFGSYGTGIDAKNGVSFFLGQPFSEYLSGRQIKELQYYLEGANIDFYVKHPREGKLISDRFPVLETDGRLGEIAIMEAARSARPVIYGCFSSVLLNLSSAVAEKYYLSIPGSPLESRHCELVRGAGCNVIQLG